MNSLYKNSLLLFSLAAFIACKKNDELLINGQYKPASTVTIDAVVMLTKEGQITNTSLIKEFVQRHGQQDYFLFDKRTDPTDNNSSTLRLDFHEDGTVDTYYMNESASSKGKISQRTSSYIDITAIESAIMPIGPNPNRCGVLMENASSPTPSKTLRDLSSTGYSSYYEFYPTGRLEIRNGQLYVPLMALLVHSKGQDQTCLSASAGSFRTFNNEIKKQLQPGDTIVYQSKRVMLIKP